MHIDSVLANAALAAVCPLFNSATIQVYAGPARAVGPSYLPSSSDTLLATFTFSNPAFGPPASASVTANSITTAIAVASGTARWARIAGATCSAAVDVSAIGGGGELQLYSTAVVKGGSIPIALLTMSIATT